MFFCLGGLFGSTQNKGFGFPSGLGTGAATGTSGFGTGLGTTGLGGFGGFNIQPTQQQQGESLYFQISFSVFIRKSGTKDQLQYTKTGFHNVFLMSKLLICPNQAY